MADVLLERGVPLTFVTGYREDATMDRYRRLPGLQKPFRSSQLSAMLVAILAPIGAEHLSRIETFPDLRAG